MRLQICRSACAGSASAPSATKAASAEIRCVVIRLDMRIARDIYHELG